jgi:hypothetical protein
MYLHLYFMIYIFLHSRISSSCRVFHPTRRYCLRRVRTSTLHNKTENFSRFNSNAYKGVFLYLVTYSHLP